jgi:hypothetical protein
MSEQTKALRLANELGGVSDALADEAAAELRRLVAENERLHQINQSHEMKLSVRGYEIQIADLKAVNQELLEALRVAVDSDLGRLWVWSVTARETWLTNARAAITKAEIL